MVNPFYSAIILRGLLLILFIAMLCCASTMQATNESHIYNFKIFSSYIINSKYKQGELILITYYI